MNTIAVNPSQKVNSYFGNLTSPKSSNEIIRIAFGTRAERRKLISTLDRVLAPLKTYTLEFIEVSKNYLELIELSTYPDLLDIEVVSLQAISDIEYRIKALNKIYDKVKDSKMLELISLSNELVKLNTQIYHRSKECISAHNTENALNNGFMFISDLDLKDGSMVLNTSFKILISSEDNEIRGEIQLLDIIVYEPTVKAVTKALKEYIIEIYKELIQTKNPNLSPNLIEIKNILKLIISKPKK